MYYLGLDIGGTNIKGSIVTGSGEILLSDSVPTASHAGGIYAVCDRIATLCSRLLDAKHMTFDDISGVGMGMPGMIDSNGERIVFSANLGVSDFPIKKELEKRFPPGFPIVIEHDSRVATYGEYTAGHGRGISSCMVVVTLGTGIGGGIIINSSIVTGTYGNSGEIGHMIVEEDGRICNCGARGCWEAYSSATGLINMTKQEMEKNPQSVLHVIAKKNGGVTGQTAFNAAKHGDESGMHVIDTYIKYLSTGLVNIINLLQPEFIVLSGGVSRAGDALLRPLVKAVKAKLYRPAESKVTEIKLSALGNDAAMIGAAMLAKAFVHRSR